jgi:hypothetical protein
MPAVSYKMGPGTFKLGTAGAFDVSCQVTNLIVAASENVESTDPIAVLCGETIDAEDTVTYSWTVSGKLVQDISATGVVDYTWDNKGTVVDFEFIPNTVGARKVTGEVRLVPLAVGGDVNSRPTSDFEWVVPAASGDPVLAAVA